MYLCDINHHQLEGSSLCPRSPPRVGLQPSASHHNHHHHENMSFYHKMSFSANLIFCNNVICRIFRTFRFGKGGEAVYLTSPTEVQRIALTKRKQKEFIEGLGTLFTVVSTPEPRQKGFFQTFFSSTPSPIDREELCTCNLITSFSNVQADIL